MQAVAFGLTEISKFSEFSVHRLVGAAHDAPQKRDCCIIGHITVWIVGKKLWTAKYSDQPIKPDKKARLFEAFADSGIRWLLVGVDRSAGKSPTIHFGISA